MKNFTGAFSLNIVGLLQRATVEDGLRIVLTCPGEVYARLEKPVIIITSPNPIARYFASAIAKLFGGAAVAESTLLLCEFEETLMPEFRAKLWQSIAPDGIENYRYALLIPLL